MNTTDEPAVEQNGYVRKRNRLLQQAGFYSPAVKGAPSTTRQTEILNPGVLAAPTNFEGILIGEDTLSKTAVAHDALTAYRRGIVDSPNVCTIGDVGAGKSSLTKSVYVLRPLLLQGRRCVVIDKKLQEGQGEYTPVANAFGIDPIRMVIGDAGYRLNLLDPALQGGDKGGGMLGVLLATTQILNDEVPLDAWEKKALRVALRRAMAHAEAEERTQVIADVHGYLGDVDGDWFRQMRESAKDRMHEAGLTVAFLLERMFEEMPGLFDGETSKAVSLDRKLTVFDIAALPEAGPSIPIAMMLINAWTLGTIKQNPGKFTTNFDVEEGWFLVGGPMGQVLRSNSKLARALGMSVYANLHHISDIPVDDPAIAFIKEAETLHLFRQAKADDAQLAAQIAGLRPGAAEALMTLPNGHHFLKVGRQAEVRVRHVRSPLETELTDSDGALTLGKKRAA